MAGRPLTLVVKDNQDGTASIRMPESAGVKQRGTLKFPSRKVAERYRTAALAAHQAGKSFPDPAPYQSALDRRKAPKIPDRFADVAWAWFKKTYPAHYKNPERRAAVEQIIETHLISFFGPRVDRISEISSEDCEEFVDFMAGERITTPTSSDDKARELTLTEAAKLTGRNRSTLQRAWQNGQFPRARKTNRGKSKGIVVIPFGDLLATKYAPVTKQLPYGYARNSVKEMLAVLSNIFTFAQARTLVSSNPSLGMKAKDPVMGSRTVRPRSDVDAWSLDLARCKQISSHLHIHHLMTFWIIRAMGLRISETFGITLGAVARDGSQMYIAVGAQAGRTFLVLDENLQVRVVTSKPNAKTKSGNRVIPVPRQLAELIDFYIEVFHEEDAEPSTPLLMNATTTGQASFRVGLDRAQQVAGYSIAELGFKPTPHTHRKFLSTDIELITPRIRSIYMGHKVKADGGAGLTESVYTLRTGNIQRLREASQAIEQKIEELIVTLVDPVPSPVIVPRELFESDGEHRRVLDLLEAHGYIAPTISGGEEVLRISEAAELLAISEVRVKRLLGEGVLEARPIQGPGMRSLGGVTLDSAMARLEADQMLWTRRRICEEFDLGAVELQRLVDKLNLKPAEVGPVKGLRYRDEEVERLRRHFETKRTGAANSVPVSGVVQEIGCSKRTVQNLITTGQLKVDQRATQALGMTMVTRSSLEQLVKARSQRPTPPISRPPGSIPIHEAQERTGLTRTEVLQLRSQGVVIYRSSDYQFHVDETSLAQVVSKAPPKSVK